MIQAMNARISTQVTIKEFKTAIIASGLSAALILPILLLQEAAASGLRRVFETTFFAFLLGATGAHVYIWLAAKLSILGRVTRTNLAATLKALLIVTPLATVLSLAGIVLGGPPDAQVWMFVEIVLPAFFQMSPALVRDEYMNRVTMARYDLWALPATPQDADAS